MTPESRNIGPIGKEKKTKYGCIIKSPITLLLITGNKRAIYLNNA